jgi:hypothetical protein
VVSDIAQNVEFETAPAAEITLFPNPCSDQLYISMPNTNELLDSQIEVKGVDGRTVLLNKRVIRNVVSLDTKDLAAGVYFVLMTRKGVVETQRFIKN